MSRVNLRDFASLATPVKDASGAAIMESPNVPRLDWSGALDAALVAARSRFSFGHGFATTPGAHAVIEAPAHADTDGFVRPYRLSRTVPLLSGDRYEGDGEASCFLFTHDGDGFLLDTGGSQSAEGFGFARLAIHTLSISADTYGIRCIGGAHADLVADVAIGGFDHAVALDGSELITIDRLKVSSWAGIGRQLATTGVRFGLLAAGGAVTNGNRVRDSQFNGPSFGIVSDDGASNLVESCNFNACGSMLLATAARNLAFRSCLGEGFSADAILCGIDGGYPGSSRRCWDGLAIEDCSISIGTPRAGGSSALMRVAIGASGWDTSFRGSTIYGARPDGLGGDLGAIITDHPSFTLLGGSWTPPIAYAGGDVHTVYAPTSPPRRAFWNRLPYGFAP